VTAALIIANSAPSAHSETPDSQIYALQRIASVFQCAGIEKVVVACNGENPWPEKHCAHRNLIFVRVKKRSANAGLCKSRPAIFTGKMQRRFYCAYGRTAFF
jgi:hypothetical protein